MLMAIIFFIVGGIITSFTLISALICLVFGIPITKKLERANLLIDNHPIIRRYWGSACFLMAVFIIVSILVYIFISASGFGGYVVGVVLAIVIGIGKIGRNANNLSDYISTQSRYFNKPAEFIAGFLNK